MEGHSSGGSEVRGNLISSADANAFRSILRTRQCWIHRQVETIHLLTDGNTRRRVSVDLDVQGVEVAGLRVLPISVLKKKVLKSFDIKSATGEALSVLNSEQSNQVEIAILRSGLMPEFVDQADELLTKIVMFDGPFDYESIDFSLTNPAYRLLFEYYNKMDKSDVALAQEMMTLAESFVRGFLLIVQVPRSLEVGDRTILKFSYEEPLELRGLMKPKRIAVYMLTDWSRSYHLEVRTPQPIAIKELSIQQIGGSEERDIPIPVRRRQALDTSGRQIAHVTISGSPSDVRFVAFCYLRADTRGLPRVASLSTFLTCLGLIMLFTSWIPRPFDPLTSYDPINYGAVPISTTILILAPSLLFAFLAKRTDHHIEARIIAGPRVALLLSGILMFLAAVASAHPISDTNWHIPIRTALPIAAIALLAFYWIWYLRATNSGVKNRRLLRSTRTKMRVIR